MNLKKLESGLHIHNMRRMLAARQSGKYALARLAGFLIGCILIGSSLAVAQLPTAAISGMVRDSSGAAIPGGTITVTSRETGLVRTAQSGADGRFKLAGLSVGVYDVKAEAPSFKAEVQQELNLSVGQEAVLNFNLIVGAVQETVTVTAAAALVDTTSGSLGGLVDEQRVADLPLNGRNFNDLVLLQPGITVHRPTSATSTTAIGLAYSSNGAPIRSNFVMLDGANLVAGGGITGVSVSGSALGIEGIREFRVITNSFPAEYGMTMGSQTTIVSKGGTNEYHGSVFEFLRNNALDARDFFDRKARPEDHRNPPFRRNNFGGSFGGPARKDKSFYFVTYEGVRESKGTTVVLSVPTAAARRDGAVIGGQTIARIAESVKPYLALYPLPTEPLPSDPTGVSGVARFSYAPNQPTREDYGQARFDHNFSERDTAFIRYTVDDTMRNSPTSFAGMCRCGISRGQFLTLAENHTFTPVLLNMFRLSFSRPFQTYDQPSPFGLPFLPTQKDMGSVAPGSGVTAMGSSAGGSALHQNLYTLSNDSVWSRGSHTIKIGTLINRYHIATLVNTNVRGTYSFSNLTQFLLGNPRQFSSITPGSVTDRTYRWNTFGFYAQDDWKASSRLTLNIGLRYEFNTTVNETSGRGASFRDFIRDTGPTLGPALYKNPALRNFSPRLGFAWDVRGNAKTAIRGGFGLLYDISNITGASQINATATPPFSSSSTIVSNVTFPVPIFTKDVVGTSLRMIDYNLQQPHMLQYNLTVERQLPGSMMISMGYAGSRGMNLYQTKEGNPTYPSANINGRDFWNGLEARLNPRYADVEFETAGGDSWYNSFQLGVQQHLSRGLQFQSSYTWSKVLDTTQGQHGGESGGANVIGVDPNHPKADKGSSDFDTRHSFSFNTLYRLPFTGRKGFGEILNGWRAGSIVTVRSGATFTPVLSGNRSRSKVQGGNPDHPDWVSGCSNVILGGPDRYFNPACFSIQPLGFLGTAGRNFLQGPGMFNWDLSLTKETHLPFAGESGRLEFRAEMFNILNRPNFSIPINGRTVYTANETTASATALATAGQIDRTISSSRQIQFALKIVF